jgi:hypothetical protein
MNIIQGIALHIIAIINASFLIYYTTLLQSDTSEDFKIKVPKYEPTTKREKTVLSARIFASLLIVVALGGLIWDTTYNYNMDDDETGAPAWYTGIEIACMLIVYGFAFTLFYQPDYGVVSNRQLSENTRNHAYGSMAVSYVFLSYVMLWMMIELYLYLEY